MAELKEFADQYRLTSYKNSYMIEKEGPKVSNYYGFGATKTF